MTTTCVPSQTPSPTSMPRAVRPCSQHGDVDAIVEVIAADEIGVGGHQDVLPHAHPRRREDLAVEPDVRAILDHDVAVLAAEDRVAARRTRRCRSSRPRLSVPFASRQHASSMTTLSPIAILCGMPERDVDAEDDVAADGAEHQRIQLRAQEQAEGAGHPAGQEHHQFVGDQRAEAGPADHEVAVLVDLGAALVEQLLLDDRDPRIVLARRAVWPSAFDRGELGRLAHFANHVRGLVLRLVVRARHAPRPASRTSRSCTPMNTSMTPSNRSGRSRDALVLEQPHVREPAGDERARARRRPSRSARRSAAAGRVAQEELDRGQVEHDANRARQPVLRHAGPARAVVHHHFGDARRRSGWRSPAGSGASRRRAAAA